MIAAAIEKLAIDKTLRSRLAEAGRSYVENYLEIHKVIHQYEKSYFQALID